MGVFFISLSLVPVAAASSAVSRFPFPVVLVLVGLGSFSFPRGDGVAGSYPSFPFFVVNPILASPSTVLQFPLVFLPLSLPHYYSSPCRVSSLCSV